MSQQTLVLAANVHEKKYELSRPLLFFDDVPNDTVSSIMVFAPTEHLAFEIGRALDDAVGVVYVAHTDNEHHRRWQCIHVDVTCRQGICFFRRWKGAISGEAFATALEVIPSTLAENHGLSPIDTLLKLRVAHSEGARQRIC